uniref:SAM domain-containing protein n=1 Tax=Rhizochromulina marina TaxID=1034831 RepID=A0A7S2SSW2_9STRA|mmetsp:Transcript_5820/g.17000  ORF Transcript_5820/g.17000 Transcript_5820/m.17000 type:complete len:124 (+) Transcript_5820:496-867(+)
MASQVEGRLHDLVSRLFLDMSSNKDVEQQTMAVLHHVLISVFLEQCNLGHYGRGLQAFGVENLADLCDEALISDDELLTDVGLQQIDLEHFRAKTTELKQASSQSVARWIKRLTPRPDLGSRI